MSTLLLLSSVRHRPSSVVVFLLLLLLLSIISLHACHARPLVSMLSDDHQVHNIDDHELLHDDQKDDDHGNEVAPAMKLSESKEMMMMSKGKERSMVQVVAQTQTSSRRSSESIKHPKSSSSS
ncbi:hypothetical protein LINGRAHAP2_LOCUS11771, partial [Linum grandiflorum]